MKKGLLFILAALMLLWCAPMAQAQVTINGAGASFPYPVYSQWAHKYHELTKIKINYQSIGSGGGIAQMKAKTVDFGGTDEPLKPADLDKHGIVQFPTVMGGVVPVINVPGVKAGELKLDGTTLAAIFQGKITKWDAPEIKKLNPDLKLPSQAITVAHRTDGSGTTFIFTSYLAAVSPDWQAKVGAGKAVKWPAPNSIGGKGNAGVAGQVKAVNGSIGYVEYAYALQNKIPHAALKNQAGKLVQPDMDTFQAAAANADWSKAPKGFSLMLINQPGEKSWPIVGATYIMVHKDYPDAAKAKEILKFCAWSYKHGGGMAKKLHYVPMPDNVVKMVEATWKEVKSGGKPVWP
ncbi:MAG: phosphate ABC transporter substrate-binding protein PstS [Syntrophales bacterium]|nr:phosphate ABC transporter substrate-binding protein PstS [Syntrophales bacterium]MDD5641976.1 phosphate ABC transporter substrate-binding protein PstS [Syntrophales bacterium]